MIDLLNFFIVTQSVTRGYEEAKKNKVFYKSFSANIYNPLPSPEDFVNIFYENNWRTQLTRKYIDIYCKKISLDKKMLKFIFLLFIFKHLYFNKEFLNIFLSRKNPIIF